MNKKLLYSAPEAELLVIKFEENIMSPQNGWSGDPVSTTTWGGSDDDDDLFN